MQIGIIGHFGGDTLFLDGQTVKTESLNKLLTEHGNSVYRVDTFYKSRNPIKLIFETFACIFKCKKIFILLSTNGMNFYLPFLHYINKIFKRDIYHYIIGSELLLMIKEKPKMAKYLNSLKVNWFEYESGTSFLREMGVKNAETLANFKFLTPLKEDEVNYSKEENKPYKFCTFSRVTAEKGITAAAETVAEINKKYGENTAILHIYGQVEDIYEAELERLTKEYDNCVFYKGMIASHDSVQTLKDYYALLFPTYWEGEGFPGTVLDAFAAGLPIIASDWNANKDLIENGRHGIIYPSETANTLFEAVEFAINNADTMLSMRKKCREEYNKYTPETVIDIILSTLKR